VEKCKQRVVDRAGEGTAYDALKKAVSGQTVTKDEATKMRHLLKRKLQAVCGKTRDLKALADGLGVEALFTAKIDIKPSESLHKVFVDLNMENFLADLEYHMDVSSTAHDSGQDSAYTGEQGGSHDSGHDEAMPLSVTPGTDEHCEHQEQMVDYRCEQTGDELFDGQTTEATPGTVIEEASLPVAEAGEWVVPMNMQAELDMSEDQSLQLLQQCVGLHNTTFDQSSALNGPFDAWRDEVLQQTCHLALIEINAPQILGELGKEVKGSYKRMVTESAENCYRALRTFLNERCLLNEIGLSNPFTIYSWIYENLCRKNTIQLFLSASGRTMSRETFQHQLSTIIKDYDAKSSKNFNIEASSVFAMLRRLLYDKLNGLQSSHPMMTLSNALLFLNSELQHAIELRMKAMASDVQERNAQLDDAIRRAIE
tara:strand:+ start:136 stop:1413 length:1278 start_codon:yes stop_codon:yes gene_type:complete